MEQSAGKPFNRGKLLNIGLLPVHLSIHLFIYPTTIHIHLAIRPQFFVPVQSPIKCNSGAKEAQDLEPHPSCLVSKSIYARPGLIVCTLYIVQLFMYVTEIYRHLVFKQYQSSYISWSVVILTSICCDFSRFFTMSISFLWRRLMIASNSLFIC